MLNPLPKERQLIQTLMIIFSSRYRVESHCMGYYLIESVFQIRNSFLHGYREHDELLFNYSNQQTYKLIYPNIHRLLFLCILRVNFNKSSKLGINK